MTALARLAIRLGAGAALAALVGLYMAAIFATDPDARLLRDIGHRADRGGAMTVDDIAAGPFTPSGPAYRGGYDQAVHWFRITINPSVPPAPIVLDVTPPVLEQLDLYLPAALPGQWEVMRTGSLVPYSQRDLRQAGLAFRLGLLTVPKTVYLRVATDTSTALTLSASPERLAQNRQDRLVALHMIFFALLFAGLLMALLRLAEQPARLSVALVGFMAVYIVYSVEALGYGALLFDAPVPAFHHRVYFLSTYLVLLLSMLFQRLYLAPHSNAGWALLWCDLAIGGQVVLFVPLLTGHIQLLAAASVACSMAFLCALVPLVISAHVPVRRVKRGLVLAYGVYVVLSATWLMSRIGVIRDPFLSRHLVEAFGLTNLFLVLLLTMLDRDEQAERQKSVRINFATARAAREAHARNAEIQENFLQMLMHEVRNHLSVLKLSLPDLIDRRRRARLTGTIHDLTDSLDKAQEMVWLVQGTWPLHPEPLPVLDLLGQSIDALGLAERVDAAGDAAEAVLTADRRMIQALFTRLLQAAASRAGPAGKITVTLTEAGAGGALSLGIAVAPDAADAAPFADDGHPPCPELDLALRLAHAAGADVLRPEGDAGRFDLMLVFPHPTLPAHNRLSPSFAGLPE